MSKRNQIARRQFLIASGVILAQAGIPVAASRAQQMLPRRQPDLATLSNPTPLSGRPPRPNAGRKIGVNPTYNIAGGGENLRNPHFRPQGQPSSWPTSTPRAAAGTGITEETAQ